MIQNTVAAAFGEFFGIEGVVRGMINDPDLRNVITNMVVKKVS